MVQIDTLAVLAQRQMKESSIAVEYVCQVECKASPKPTKSVNKLAVLSAKTIKEGGLAWDGLAVKSGQLTKLQQINKHFKKQVESVESVDTVTSKQVKEGINVFCSKEKDLEKGLQDLSLEAKEKFLDERSGLMVSSLDEPNRMEPQILDDKTGMMVLSLDEKSSLEERSKGANGLSQSGENIKRSDYLSWNEYFMAVSFLSALRSKDPMTQVGACIVNEEKKIVGIGYNGMPRGCPDDSLPWGKEASDPLETKYMYVCHAEMNAILNKNSASVSGCVIYVALFPCNECAKMIIQSGIKEVIYFSDKHATDTSTVAAKRLLAMAGVTVRQFKPRMNNITIDFKQISESVLGKN